MSNISEVVLLTDIISKIERNVWMEEIFNKYHIGRFM